jgi:hypothetical protein
MRKDQAPPEGLTKNSKLWRYISVPKLVAMLSKRQMYFCRVDKLEDQREAMLSRMTVDLEVGARLGNETIQEKLGDRPDGEILARLTAGSSDMRVHASIFVNCWYHSEDESVAMWKVYGAQGIAIQSTWRWLMEALPDGNEVAVGVIQYVDYDSTYISPHQPFLYKDRIYEHEREIRAMVKRPPRELSILSVCRDHPSGIDIDVDLNRLIKRIYLAPGAGGWFRAVVEELLEKYGLGLKEVKNSIADEVPEYRQLYIEAWHTLIEKAYPLQPYIYEEGERENPWTYFLPKADGE